MRKFFSFLKTCGYVLWTLLLYESPLISSPVEGLATLEAPNFLNKKRFIMSSLISIILASLLTCSCFAQTVFVAGYTSMEGLINTFTLGDNVTTNIPLEGGGANVQLLCMAVDSHGNAFFGGKVGTNPFFPVIYQLAAGASEATLVTLPQIFTSGAIEAVAVDSTGRALFVGGGDNDALILSLEAGSSSASLISSPSGTNQATLYCIAINSKGTAVIGGSYYSLSDLGIIWTLPKGSSTVNVISGVSDHMQLTAVAIDSNDNAILVGSQPANPLCFRLSPDGTLTRITIPSEQGGDGLLSSVAIGPNNVATLGGDDGTGLPYIYTLAPLATTASYITPPSINVAINCVAIDSNNDAFLGGNEIDLPAEPYIFYVADNASTASNITVSTSNMGEFDAAGVGVNNTVILCGSDNTAMLPMIYTTSAGASATSIPISGATSGDGGSFNCIAFFSIPTPPPPSPSPIAELIKLINKYGPLKIQKGLQIPFQ